MNDPLVLAYLDSSDGYSPDRVVADPMLGFRFVSLCTERGLEGGATALNRRLLNARKSGALQGLRRSKKTSFPNEQEYRFACEVAVRHLERKHGVALDTLICDPILTAELDSIASSIVPGFSPLQYRWAALNLRKARRLKPELVPRVLPADVVQLGDIKDLDVERVPTGQGVYVFYGPEQTLYVGEARRLRRRVAKHLDHSDNKGLARWLWEHGYDRLLLEVHALPDTTSATARRAYEAELIKSRCPLFNVQHVE